MHIQTFLSVCPHSFIYITANIISCNASEESISSSGESTLRTLLWCHHMLHPWPLAGPFGYVDAGHIPSTSRKRKIPLLDLGMVSREGDIPSASYHVLQTTVWQHLSGENAHYHKQQHAYSDGLQLDPSHSQGLCPCKECQKKSADVVCCMDQDGVYGWGRRFLRWLHT